MRSELVTAEKARALCVAALAKVNPRLAGCVNDLAATQTALDEARQDLVVTQGELGRKCADLAASQKRIFLSDSCRSGIYDPLGSRAECVVRHGYRYARFSRPGKACLLLA